MPTAPKRLAAVAVTASVIATAAVATSANAVAKAQPMPQHVFYIMMENHGYNEIIGNRADAPYVNSLASTYNVATNFHGVTHPSLPNYLAAVSGDFQGIWDDCKAGADVRCAPEEFVPGSGDSTDGDYLTQQQIDSASATPHMFNGSNLVDQLESAGLSWKAYMESMPAGEATRVEYYPGTVDDGQGGTTTVKLYAQKHNPFFYFSDIVNNPARVAKVVPFENNFTADLASGHVANFVWISPNQCNDMHGLSTAGADYLGNPACATDDGAIQEGDAFLQHTVGEIMSSRTWQTSTSTIIISWDENDYSGNTGGPGSPTGVNGYVLGGGDAPLIVVNNDGGARRTSDQIADHYTVLSAIEKLWHLGCLANTCQGNTSGNIQDLFQH